MEMERFLNKPLSSALPEAEKWHGKIRVIKPGEKVSPDRMPNRFNIVVDKLNNVSRMYYG